MNNINPLVSVIIPTYGRPDLLSRAIDSVLSQSYSDIEIVIVDDNNFDSPERKETESVMKKYLEENKIIYVKMTKNSGGAIARNKGVESSTGELICFLDDDDEFLPNKVQLQVEKYLESKSTLSVIGGYANILDANGNLKRIEKNEINGDVFKIQLGKNICTTSIAMINRNTFLEAGGFSNVPSSQEHTLFIKIFSINPLYDYINAPVVNIYHHDGVRISTSTKKVEGAILLHEYVSSFYDLLTKEEIVEVNNSHYVNIIRANMHTKNNRRNAFRYLWKLIRSKKCIDREILKVTCVIFLGFDQIERIKTYIKNEK